MQSRLEAIILSAMFFNEQYVRKVLPHIKADYFEDRTEALLYTRISNFVTSYNARPTKEAILVQVMGETDGITDEQAKEIQEFLSSIKEPTVNDDWLIEQTEKWCQDRAIYLGIYSAIDIVSGKGKTNLAKGEIPQILSDALAVSFDTKTGHAYLEDAEDRFFFYQKKEKKYPFDLKYFNKITAGGVPQKTLNVILAGVSVGKSLALCHFAAAYLAQGLNALYITLEMAEERIGERIDANLLNIPVTRLKEVPSGQFKKLMDRLKTRCRGELIIKEYPTATASVVHFRHLLHELKIKRNFIPDVIFIDYLNIAASSRLKQGAGVNSYTYIKAIAEEFRGLAVEYNVPLFTATQLNRAGFGSSDFGMDDTAESFGLPAVADFMFGIISSEDLETRHQIQIKQLKNRYNGLDNYKKFLIGIDKTRMRLYDLDETEEQQAIEANKDKEDKPSFDKTPFGKRVSEEDTGVKKFGKWKFK